ncbi:hypothetical protein [Halorubrum salipaludis]|uniref:hypothetical protein n=1 Tax=Halorubrum salipaludis TaxID=2032630 RepID=UPI0011817C46|nr:hypothetical protein [Halorubrum salipaludis]
MGVSEEVPDIFDSVRMRLRQGYQKLYIILLRAYKGLYSRWWGLFIGCSLALILAIGGYLIGPHIKSILARILHFGIFDFNKSELSTLWAVHATIIGFGLVALSFAWNQIQDLPTDPGIIAEVAHRLRSIEIISFLLFSNLIIGAAVLRLGDGSVPPEIGFPAGILFFASLVFILERFWHVLDLLLHNTLDDNVEKYARDHLSGKFHSPAGDFDSYLGHFFEASRHEIDADRPDQLREKLRRVEILLEVLLEKDETVATDTQLWDFVFSNYDSLYRRSIKQQNEELEEQVVASLSGVYWISMNRWRDQN